MPPSSIFFLSKRAGRCGCRAVSHGRLAATTGSAVARDAGWRCRGERTARLWVAVGAVFWERCLEKPLGCAPIQLIAFRYCLHQAKIYYDYDYVFHAVLPQWEIMTWQHLGVPIPATSTVPVLGILAP